MTTDQNDDDLDLGYDLEITKTTRRVAASGTWVCGTHPWPPLRGAWSSPSTPSTPITRSTTAASRSSGCSASPTRSRSTTGTAARTCPPTTASPPRLSVSFARDWPNTPTTNNPAGACCPGNSKAWPA